MHSKNTSSPLKIFIIAALVTLITSCTSVPTTMSYSAKNIAYYTKQGTGPSVVFQSGLGDGKSVWADVLQKLPANVAVFAYDRPGYGDSPSASDERSPCRVSRELHHLLHAEMISPPYVLVGHSQGGLYMFCFAKLYPNEVKGLVLIDPTHPQHWERMQEQAPLQAALIKSLKTTLFSKVMRQEFDSQASCLNEIDMQTPVTAHTKFLFSGQFKLAEMGKFEHMVKALRENWLTKFTNATSLEVSNSGHYIQTEQPAIVASAIEEILAAPQ